MAKKIENTRSQRVAGGEKHSPQKLAKVLSATHAIWREWRDRFRRARRLLPGEMFRHVPTLAAGLRPKLVDLDEIGRKPPAGADVGQAWSSSARSRPQSLQIFEHARTSSPAPMLEHA